MQEANTLSLAVGQSTYTLVVLEDRYAHGGSLAVELFDESNWESFATVSINVPETRLGDDEFVFKTYSENEGFLEQMLAAGFVEMTGRSADIGPICRLLKSSGEMKDYLSAHGPDGRLV